MLDYLIQLLGGQVNYDTKYIFYARMGGSKMGLGSSIIGLIILLLLMALVTVAFVFPMTKSIYVECEEYEEVPVRYGGLFGSKAIRTIEGNHDAYERECINGTTAYELFYGGLFGGEK